MDLPCNYDWPVNINQCVINRNAFTNLSRSAMFVRRIKAYLPHITAEIPFAKLGELIGDKIPFALSRWDTLILRCQSFGIIDKYR